MIVSLPGGLSNREDNNGGAPRAKHMCIPMCMNNQSSVNNAIQQARTAECIHTNTHDIHTFE